MSPAEIFSALRAKFMVGLEEKSAELATVRSTLAAADAVHGKARTAWQDLNTFLASGDRSASEGTPAPLRHEILNSRTTLDAAERARGAARAVIKNLEYEISELALAIDHVDRSLTAAKVTQFPRAVEPTSRPKPPPVDYDNIEMPRTAAANP